MLMEMSNGGVKKKKHSHKSSRKQNATIEGSGREQESARALFQLQAKVPLNGGIIPASVDGIAASTMFSAVKVNGKDHMEAHGRNQAHQVPDRGSMRKRQRYESREHGMNFTAQGRDDGSSKRARLKKNIKNVKSSTALVSSSLITSDVTMQETIANLLPGDDQEVCSSGTSPKPHTMAKPNSIMQRLIGKAENERSDAPIQPSDRLPSLVFDTPQRQDHMKERNNQTQFRIESGDAAAHEQPSHQGQHSFSFVLHSNGFVCQM